MMDQIIRNQESVNKVQKKTFVNRLSPMQQKILSYLNQACAFEPLDTIGHLPRTGDVIAGIGREKNPRTYAAVSRSLRRLSDVGLVSIYIGGFSRGKGCCYALAGRWSA